MARDDESDGKTPKSLNSFIEIAVEKKSDDGLTDDEEEEDEGGTELSRQPSVVPSLYSRHSSVQSEFYHRDTSRPGYDLRWSKVCVSAGSFQILDHAWGAAYHAQTTAILGPVSSGKTTVLNVLAGRQRRASGCVMLDEREVRPSDYARSVAYVMQDDALIPEVTVREAVEFSAKLQRHSFKSHDRLVRSLLHELDLSRCADMRVGGGGSGRKGISGGQRKRLSVAIQLVTSPEIILLDEPTSGLDSESALRCVAVLAAVAKLGAIVLTTIHQPGSDVFDLLDRLVVMKRGCVMYAGAREDVLDTFAARGFPAPEHFNVAEHMLKVAHLDDNTLAMAGFFARDATPSSSITTKEDDDDDDDDGRWDLGRSSFEVRHSEPGLLPTAELCEDLPAVVDNDSAPISTQLRVLIERDVLIEVRQFHALVSRIVVDVFSTAVIACIYYDAGREDYAKKDRLDNQFNSLSLICLFSLAGNAMSVILTVAYERRLFVVEYLSGTYAIAPYIISKVAIQLVKTYCLNVSTIFVAYMLVGFRSNFWVLTSIIWALSITTASIAFCVSAATPDAKTATELYPIIFMPQYLFCGLFVRNTYIPSFLRWARYCCALTYSLNLAVLEEFTDSRCRQHSDEPELAAAACKELKNALLVDANSAPRAWAVLAGMFVAFRAIGAIALHYTGAEHAY
ncbi:hypothetical protein CTAYLR_003193 [Chrysophaeum taylorii]|uniref:ABC transporter domain-containing protein n=1 Tax=Chrysophaeum taylorii TaxID=2483200 RepID=A0AAD7UD27_9STRA|nr:hypothetical protein CTAYLR_003193 [Chrysophaeum taylorii]